MCAAEQMCKRQSAPCAASPMAAKALIQSCEHLPASQEGMHVNICLVEIAKSQKGNMLLWLPRASYTHVDNLIKTQCTKERTMSTALTFAPACKVLRRHLSLP
jgi:hypothetical protein